jgi:hypothetical protein
VPITTKVVSSSPGRWFSPGTPVSFNKTDSHEITEILLKVAFNPITPTATMTHYPDSEPTNLGLTPEYCILQSSIIFCCKIPILHQSLAKYAQILLVMADRTDEVMNSVRSTFFSLKYLKRRSWWKLHHQGEKGRIISKNLLIRVFSIYFFNFSSENIFLQYNILSVYIKIRCILL